MFTTAKENKDTYRLSDLLAYQSKYNNNTKNEDALVLGKLIHQRIQNQIRILNPNSVVEPSLLVYSKDLDCNIAMHGDLIINNTLYEIKSRSSLINNKEYCITQASVYYHAFNKFANIDSLKFIQYDITQNHFSVYPLQLQECLYRLKKGLKYAVKSNEQFYLLRNGINSNNEDLVTIRKSNIVEMLLMLRDGKLKMLEEYLINLYKIK